VKMSQDQNTSRSAGSSKTKSAASAASKGSHPSYAMMIQQSLAALKVS